MSDRGNDSGRNGDDANGSPLFPDTEWRSVIRKLHLTPRQADVVGCLLEGSHDKQIAKRLKMGTRTVRAHLSTLFSRLRVADRVELVLLVVRTAREGDGNDGDRQS